MRAFGFRRFGQRLIASSSERPSTTIRADNLPSTSPPRRLGTRRDLLSCVHVKARPFCKRRPPPFQWIASPAPRINRSHRGHRRAPHYIPSCVAPGQSCRGAAFPPRAWRAGVWVRAIRLQQRIVSLVFRSARPTPSWLVPTPSCGRRTAGHGTLLARSGAQLSHPPTRVVRLIRCAA